MDWDRLLDAGAAARVREALADPGAARPVRLALGDLQAGQAGILEAQVRMVAAARPYRRKNGSEGLLARVTLADGTGEADLVLWDEEVRLCQDGPLQPGAFVRIHGPLVKAGYRGGVELGVGAAQVVALPPAQAATAGPLEGTLVGLGEVRPVGAPPAMRFTCDLRVATDAGAADVTAWDEAVKQARALGVGARVRFPAPKPNPFLPGWWTAERVEAAPPAPPAPSATHK